MINKIIYDLEPVISQIKDGASILVGGQTNVGMPHNLLRALLEKDVKDLHIIANYPGVGEDTLSAMFRKGMIRKITCSFARSLHGKTGFMERYEKGEVELEMVPQGTLSERIRAGGAGIAGFYTPTGVGTVVAEGKETKVIDGQEYLLEYGITADFALLKGHKADRMGNVVYNKSARNWNPQMATAGRVTLIEVDEVVPVGSLDPEHIITPGIYIDYVYEVPKK